MCSESGCGRMCNHHYNLHWIKSLRSWKVRLIARWGRGAVGAEEDNVLLLQLNTISGVHSIRLGSIAHVGICDSGQGIKG